MPAAAIFLDRDGVLNKSIVIDGMPTSPMTADAVELYADVPDACRRLKAAGFLLICVTNQPNIARGIQSADTVHAISIRLAVELGLDDMRVCPHDDGDGCHCRKPKPGLILDAARDHGIDLAASFMVGDRWRDIDAGRAAGCRTIWIDRGYAERGARADLVCQGLGDAAERICGAE
ncbi:MAG: HAD family hydrolase [Rhodospirillales bacterium]